MTDQQRDATVDALVSVLRHDIANYLMAVSAGTELLADGNPAGAELAAEGVRRIKDVLSQKAASVPGDNAAKRAGWVLQMLLQGCGEIEVMGSTLSASGRPRPGLVEWAQSECADLGASLELSERTATIHLSR